MAVTSKVAKVQVTLNGSGFGKPSEVSYSNDGEISLCHLTYPAGLNNRFKALKSDIFRVYVGLDDYPDIPQFTGHLVKESGINTTSMELVGSLNRAVNDKRFVNDYDNFDGQEIGTAIASVFSEVSELSWMTMMNEITDPVVTVPKGTRFTNGISKYDLMRTWRDMAVNPADPLHISRYTLFQHGDYYFFRKIPKPADTSPWAELAYGDTLLHMDPESSVRFAYNKAVVIGKDGVTGEFQNDHRIAVDGLAEADILSNSEIPNAGEAHDTARATVLSDMLDQTGLIVNSHLLLEMIPNVSVVEITGAPFGLSNKYLVRSINLHVSESGTFIATAKVNIPVDALSNAMSQLLNVSGSGSASLALQ